MSATGDRAEGTIREAAGKITGDRRTEAEGKTQKTAGKAEEKMVDVKKDVEGAVEKVRSDR